MKEIDAPPAKNNLRPAKSYFSRQESERDYDMFDWCQEFDELIEDQSDIKLVDQGNLPFPYS